MTTVTNSPLAPFNLPAEYLVHGYVRIIQQILPQTSYYNIFIDIIEIIFMYYFQDKKRKYKIKNEIFELYEYYKPIKLIGYGTYSVICEAIDQRTQKPVAIKKLKHIFDDITDTQRILKQCKLLAYFTEYNHPLSMQIYDAISPKESEINVFENIYIVMPLLQCNLCRIITSKQKLTNLHYKYITYQILRGLKFIHECGIIHKDIKPENILLHSDYNIKIIGCMSCRELKETCEYVCTRWYVSPESLVSDANYNEKADIWGIGCILAEMILRRPLFPGANYLDQLQQIFDIMGTPTNTEWISNTQAKLWVERLEKHCGKNFKKMFQRKFNDQTELETCCDLLYKLLVLNPANRISAADALEHVYFKDLHDPNEIIKGKKFELSKEFQKLMHTKADLRKLVYSTFKKLHQQSWPKIVRNKKKTERAKNFN